MSERWNLRERSEKATADKLRSLDCEVHAYGQALLSPAARELLRDDASAWERWLPDFLVKTPGAGTVLVDAKFAMSGTPNHSIEMRALWAAHRETRPVWYVCSFYEGGKFAGFRAINSRDVPTDWPCCTGCLTAYQTNIAMLPAYCPVRITSGSRTPWVVVRPEAFPDSDPFGLRAAPLIIPAKPCRVCGGGVPPGGRWDDLHPACRQWPTSGAVYGPPIYADTRAITGIDPAAGR